MQWIGDNHDRLQIFILNFMLFILLSSCKINGYQMVYPEHKKFTQFNF